MPKYFLPNQTPTRALLKMKICFPLKYGTPVPYTLLQGGKSSIQQVFLRIPGKYKENVLSEASEEVSGNIGNLSTIIFFFFPPLHFAFTFPTQILPGRFLR
jgi:hypothetical protein